MLEKKAGLNFDKIRRKLVQMGLLMPIWANASENKVGQGMFEKIYDANEETIDGFVHPIASLATVGEKLNVLIRIRKSYPYTFNFVFVERQDWPEQKQRQLREIYDGIGEGIERGGKYRFGDSSIPYPIKLRLQFDSIDLSSAIHVEIIHAERSRSGYLTYYPDRYPQLPDGKPSIIWRAQGIYGLRDLKPGIYRICIENLRPSPEIDFETLLQFYVNRRKA